MLLPYKKFSIFSIDLCEKELSEWVSRIFFLLLTLTKFVTAVDTACIGRLRSGISWPASPSSWMMTSRDTWNKCRFNFNWCMLRYVVCYNLTSFSIIFCKILKESRAHKKRQITSRDSWNKCRFNIYWCSLWWKSQYPELRRALEVFSWVEFVKRCQVLEYQKTI